MSQSTLTPIKAKFGKTVSNTALVLTDAAIGFSATEVQNADEALFTIETQAVRYSTDTTTDPTTSTGHIMAVGEYRIIGCDLIRNLKIIRSGGSDSTVNITLLKR